MAENSKIEWCHHTVNLWWGCYEVHKGCDNCYAKTFSNRYHGPHLLWQQQGPRMVIKSALTDIAKYQARAAKAGVKYYIFMNSMSDIFEKPMPMVDLNHQPLEGTTEDLRNMFFSMVEDCPNLIFLLLTKRPSNIIKMIPQTWIDKPRPNVIFGTSIVDQDTADTLIPQLIKVPGLHFLSMEPLVGPVIIIDKDVEPIYCCNGFECGCMGRPINEPTINGIDWVIVGGESGHDARPMNKEWAIHLLKQCRSAGIPFFFKQWGEWTPLQPYSDAYGTQYFTGFLDGEHRSLQNNTDKKWPEFSFKWEPGNSDTKVNKSIRVGKKLAGSMLGHNTYKEFPI